MSNDLSIALTINEAKKILDKIFTNGDTSIRAFLHSSPGIGKSSIVKQLTDKHNLELIDLRLSTIEATDLCGIPFVHNGEQKFSIPDWFPTDKKSKGVIFLDELSNSSIEKQQAAYRLVLDREIQNKVRLPDGWFVVAAGNLKTDQTGAKSIVPALANRFSIHLTIKSSVEEFTSYAIENKIDERIVGFLNFAPNSIYKTPTQDSIGFPTPRSWEQASNLLKLNFTDSEIINVLGGCVGHGTACEFISYLKFYKDLPNFKEIMENGGEYKIPQNDLGLMFAVTSSLLYLFVENYKQTNKIKRLNGIFEQLSDECLIFIYKAISNLKNVDMIMNVMEVTKQSYVKIEKYIK